jgi:hypothetical protein
LHLSSSKVNGANNLHPRCNCSNADVSAIKHFLSLLLWQNKLESIAQQTKRGGLRQNGNFKNVCLAKLFFCFSSSKVNGAISSQPRCNCSSADVFAINHFFVIVTLAK